MPDFGLFFVLIKVKVLDFMDWKFLDFVAFMFELKNVGF
jgi:hypothetical protein